MVSLVLIGGAAFAGTRASDESTSGDSLAAADATPTSFPVLPDDEAEEPAEEPTEAPVTPLEVGQGFTYSDGVEVILTKLDRYQPSDYAAGVEPGQEAVRATLTITNNGNTVYDADLLQVAMSGGSIPADASQIFDDKLTGMAGSIAVGKSKSGTFAFAFDKGEAVNLGVEVTPGFEYEGALFEGEVA